MVIRNRNRPALGRFGEARESWVRVNATEVVTYVYDKPDVDEDGDEVDLPGGDIPEVRLSFRTGARRPLNISLTGLRADELNILQEFLNNEFDRVRPMVERLDQIAEEAFQNGDDSFARLYRPVPIVHRRERGKSKHRQGVRVGPEGASGGDGGDISGPAGGAGGGLADGGPQDVGAQDDVPEGDVGQSVGEVGGPA